MLKQVSERIYFLPCEHETDRPNLGYIRGERMALMFDCGASPAHVEKFTRALDEQGLPRPDLAVISHWHWDHSFGACALDIPVLASLQTDEKLREMARWSWDEAAMERRLASGEEILFCHHMIHQEYGNCSAVRVRGADIVFQGEVTIDLGEVTCRLIHVGGPHADDSVICYVPEERFVLIGDAHGRDLYGKPWHYDPQQPERLTSEMDKIPYDREKLEQFRAALRALDFAACLPGHEEVMRAQTLYNVLSE